MKLIKFIISLLFSLILFTLSFAQTADHTILVSNYSFTPSELTIAPGDKVAFINVEGLHNVNGITNTLTGDSFNNPEDFFISEIEGIASGVLMGEITFDQPGTYQYDCSIGLHAQLGMTGSIEVDAFTITDLLLTDTIPETNLPGLAFRLLLDSLLDSNGPLTLFIPNQSAVNEVQDLLNLNQFDLLGFVDLPAALEYHVATGLWLADDLNAGMILPTVYGQNLTVSEVGGDLQINGATIVSTNYLADNGVVHVIDKCLAPSGLPKATIWDIVKESDNHQLLEEAIINTGLVELLRAQNDLDPSLDLPGPFTLFAPTDAAFEAYGQQLGVSSAELVAGQFADDIVKAHIIGSKKQSTDLFNGQQLPSYFPEINQTNQITINSNTIFVEGIPIEVADIQAYNGVVHSIEEIILPELPDLVGTCGTWRLVLEEESGYYSEGWEGIFIDVRINGELISKESGFVNNNPSSFEFGVDEESVVDIVVNTDITDPFDNFYITPALNYKLYGTDNELIYSSGDAGELMSSVYGLAACGAPLSCGFVDIQMFDGFPYDTDGWDFGRIDVDINNDFYRSIPFVYGRFQQAFIPTNNGDIIDINYIPGFVPSENSYLVNAPDGTLIASQVSASNPPESVLDLLICEEATSIKNQSIDLNTSIYPNPTFDELYIKSDVEILEVEIISSFGQKVFNATYDNVALDVSNLQSGTYILKVQTVNGLEIHKFSVLQ